MLAIRRILLELSPATKSAIKEVLIAILLLSAIRYDTVRAVKDYC